ncbi:MAG: signal peptide peptidase SppA, partial [Proteobacteria bacterium]|nr:signal peptide peptidase SppA [Pseudomonadota bacterium]
RDLLDGLWRFMRDDIAASRKLAPAAIDAHVNDIRGALAAAGGDAAKAALAAGLVDRFSTRDEWRARLIEAVGTDHEGKDVRTIEAEAYLALAADDTRHAAGSVAVIVAQGTIVDGAEPAGVVAGDTFARLIREAREDEDIKALVLRIDSPGGSAWASELIRRELELTRQAGKPVIASMSSVAASGGYWIATGADEIWAAPSTVTGSIGIFGLFPEFSEPLRRLGIGVDGVATAPLAGALDPRRPLDPAAAEAMQLGIEHGYRRFLEVVAQARKMTVAEVDAVARGRVWTGEAASGLGLVDKLGSLDDAIAAAAARAGLAEHQVVWPAAGESLEQRVLRRLLRTGEDLGIDLAGRSAPAAPLAAAAADVERAARALLRWNDPRHHYLHCLCDAP